VAAIVTMAAMVVFYFLPSPEFPQGYRQTNENPMASFKKLMQEFKDPNALKMSGLFINSSLASATAQGILIPFFCSILHKQP
jgi:hypothetical protein